MTITSDKEIERRVDLAVTLQSIDLRLANIEGKQDACKEDRTALYARMELVDRQLTAVDVKQKGILKITWLVGLGITSLIGKTIWSMIHFPKH